MARKILAMAGLATATATTIPTAQLQSSVISKQSSVMFFREGVRVPHLSVHSDQ